MSRRTPILAIILAPVALFLLVQLWTVAVVPLYRSVHRSVWYGDTVLQWRLDSERPAARISAVRDIGLRRAEDTALLGELVAHLESDGSLEVRKASATAVGQVGWYRSLSAEAIEALTTLVLTEHDEALLVAAIGAVGQSAPNNRYPDPVIERIAAVFSEEHLGWVYLPSATALGQVGAARPLPDTVFAVMNALFADSVRPGEREYIANAFSEMAKGRRFLPVTTLDLLVDAFEQEPNPRIRRAIIYALAHAAADHPPAVALITKAASGSDADVVDAAGNGLRIIEHHRDFAGRDPLALAVSTDPPTEVRLKALRILRSSPIDPAAFEQIATLARDPEPEVAVAALEMFHYLAHAPADDFDRGVLIPELTRAMSDPDPLVREAAYGALSTISIHRPAYLRAADFSARLEAGANDPEPRVRVVALGAMLRDASGAAQRNAVLERGLTDPDPYVRRMTVSWLGSPRTQSSRRQELIAQALTDSDPGVRVTGESSQEEWESRKRAWPIELWRLWQAGEYGQVGVTILTAVTVATPILIGGAFLLYYMARLLTFLQQRRRRAAAVVLVIAAWAVATYGMFMLYFVAGLAGYRNSGEMAVLAGILWAAITVYATLGWGMHYAVRR